MHSHSIFLQFGRDLSAVRSLSEYFGYHRVLGMPLPKTYVLDIPCKDTQNIESELIMHETGGK